MGMSGQRHALAALYARGKNTQYPLHQKLGTSGKCQGQQFKIPDVKANYSQSSLHVSFDNDFHSRYRIAK
jgi:hypothetical protein